MNISTYDEQFIIVKLDAFKRSAKHILPNTENYTNFAELNVLKKSDANNLNASDKLCIEIATRNLESSEIIDSDNNVSKITQNCCNSSTVNETTYFPNSLFALNRPTEQLNKSFSNFKRIAQSFKSVLLMSPTNEETLSQIKQTTPSKVCLADQASPSTAPTAPVTLSTPGKDTKNVTHLTSRDDIYTD